ncbi:methyl-accepting chemotaxis protein [Fusibacter ferrireducens]|uniref:CZB domain-containing protein n=1 Tax=Fusibacter ferrireducens TaxID=2785058 RepID=A0ABR9ZSV4_9FIRM|nr:methyl-accepting chemotaxis protein [Fusibacter ferrireducens]MBF4693539.1 CZB domain-containing protein [Fusibacter ferrireducens]
MSKKLRLFKKKPCEEAVCIIEYVDQYMEGNAVEEPKIEYSIHKDLMTSFKKLFQNEKAFSDNAQKLLSITTEISGFDVNMSHSSKKLKVFASELSNVSESNLAIVEETTASMITVNETISDVTDKLDYLSEQSKALQESNQQGVVQINNVVELKEEVMSDANQMKIQIEQLVEMTNQINNIVADVDNIAAQTNLLALNASIEAARAGEHGRGFAVVAEEIRKLAETTKESLGSMRGFVDAIKVNANEGIESMNNTLRSTNDMSQQIDVISKTMDTNISMLETTINTVNIVHDSVRSIRSSADEITQAMETSSQDAESLSVMTKSILEDASNSESLARNISKIDDELSKVVKDSLGALHGGKNAIKLTRVSEEVDKAIIAHQNWMSTLNDIVQKKTLLPLQINDKKCAFGHFYHSVIVDDSRIVSDWQTIDALHHKLHETGGKIVDLIERNERSKAIALYEEADGVSHQIIEIMHQISERIKSTSYFKTV